VGQRKTPGEKFQEGSAILGGSKRSGGLPEDSRRKKYAIQTDQVSEWRGGVGRFLRSSFEDYAKRGNPQRKTRRDEGSRTAV